MNIAHLLLGSATEFRDLVALAHGSRAHLTYRELWRKVSVMSMHLRVRFGLQRGDRVAFAMANCVEVREVMHAIWRRPLRGADERRHAKEFAFILRIPAPLCFVTPDLATTIAEAAREALALRIVDTTTRPYTFMEVGDQPDGRRRADRSGVAVLPRAPPAAEGRHAHRIATFVDDAQLLCRCRSPRAARLDRACRPDQPRFGPVELPCWRAVRSRSFPKAASTRCPRRSS